jgi:D-alanyl-D-alanine carboxypeptidase (penicillin-binding protein 5/6)
MSSDAPRPTSHSIGIRLLINKSVVAWVVSAAVLLGVLALPSMAHAAISASDRVDGRSPSELGVPRDAMPDVSMRAGALVTSDGRVLWSREAGARRSIASLTKVMVAVVAMENAEPTEVVTVSREAQKVGESTSFLREGQRLPLSELLEALLIKSGNDASVAIAVHVSGSEAAFVDLMNSKAQELGLKQTRFVNSHGLDAKGHHSSAEDMAVLARYAMSKPEFSRIVRKKRARIGSGKGSITVDNTNLLIGNYTGVNGVKTGFTSQAGYCLIGSARRGDVSLLAVVLGTGSDVRRIREARELLDFGFAHFRAQRLVSAGTVIGEAPVTDYLDLTVPAAVSQDMTATVLDFAGPITRTVSMSAVEAPVRAGDKVGVATFTQAGDIVATISLVATADVPRPNLFERVGIALARAWRALSGVG